MKRVPRTWYGKWTWVSPRGGAASMEASAKDAVPVTSMVEKVAAWAVIFLGYRRAHAAIERGVRRGMDSERPKRKPREEGHP